jgi:hypothetical protein
MKQQWLWGFSVFTRVFCNVWITIAIISVLLTTANAGFAEIR